ncbi:hypothetical protein [Lysobacter sp. TAF61]|uniref:hypothetical protein n=1 Tax=Lysobacter sp. TAF61 TaxID=3233072 RepID=UPI003F970100
MAAGGLDALQAVVIIVALPFALLLVAVMVSLHRVLSQDLGRRERDARELHRAELRWLTQERERSLAGGNDQVPPGGTA